MKNEEKTIFSEDYRRLIDAIAGIRHKKGLTVRQLAAISAFTKSAVSEIETYQRRLDVKEYFALMTAMKVSKKEALALLDRIF